MVHYLKNTIIIAIVKWIIVQSYVSEVLHKELYFAFVGRVYTTIEVFIGVILNETDFCIQRFPYLQAQYKINKLIFVFMHLCRMLASN